MNRLMKRVFTVSLLLLLSACVVEPGYKVQVEPTLPVPVLIVPDRDSSNNPNNNPNAPYQRNNPPQYNGHHHDEHRHGHDDGGGSYNQPQYEEDDYPYQN